MSTTNKFKIGDIVAFNFTEVKTPMRIRGIRKERYVRLEHRDLGYDCGEIDMQYVEKWKKEYEKIQDTRVIGIDLAHGPDTTIIGGEM